jgi:TRAP-type C4-dicarboxylate transport system substrate-binding protein
MSLRNWNALEPQQQEWLQKAVDDSVAFQRILWEESTQEALEGVKEAGVMVTYPDKQPFMDAVAEMKASFDGTDMGELLKAIEAVE